MGGRGTSRGEGGCGRTSGWLMYSERENRIVRERKQVSPSLSEGPHLPSSSQLSLDSIPGWGLQVSGAT